MRRFMLAAASVAALACLGGCSDGGSDGGAVAEVVPTASASPTSLDPYAWTPVSYKEYLDAAEQIHLRPDVLVPEFGFDSGLDKLCHTTPADFATLRKGQMANTRDTDTYTNAHYLGDEVALRLGLACPQRMGDWTATDDEHAEDDTSDDDVSEVTDEELKRAEAEEADATSSPEPSSDDRTPSPAPSSSDSASDDGSSTSSGGVTTGNSTPQH